MTIAVDSESHPGTVVLTAVGELDVHTEPLLRAAVLGLPPGTPTIVIADLTGLTFMDSSGLGVLVATHKQARAADGGLRVVCSPGPVLRMLEITGLRSALDVYPTFDEAIAASS
ncbi:MAG: STAS domain-containing protein [Marmoricola sp.]